MAIDEAVLNEIAAGNSPPTLRLYGWNPPAVSIGYFQSLDEEVDTEVCKKLGIDIVRRATGGGAVFHEHEITYSIHIPETLEIVPNGILESYEKICGGIIKGLAELNVEAKFAPINDIVVFANGAPKKISGNAQTRRKGIILQHGTILLKVDVDKMFSLLKVPDEKLKGKLIENVKQRVIGLSDIIGSDFSYKQAVDVFKNGFMHEFSGINFENGALSENEKKLAENLKKNKYGAEKWNRKK